MPATMSARLMSREVLAGSPSSTIPRITVPTAPTPTQTLYAVPTGRDFMRRRAQKLAILLMCLISWWAVGLASADETCNSPYVTRLITGQEDYVYVWALGVEGVGDGFDKLVTIDVNPKSKSYGKVLGSVAVGVRNEAHHMTRVPSAEMARPCGFTPTSTDRTTRSLVVSITLTVESPSLET